MKSKLNDQLRIAVAHVLHDAAFDAAVYLNTD
jgi:hypothetical protein